MSAAPPRIETARLTLRAGTEALAAAELADRARFAALLEAQVPPEWPPESLRDALPVILAHARAGDGGSPWSLGWYALWRGTPRSTLCASVGFKGAPRDGVVEVGYSVLPEFQRRGVATEMVHAMAAWALQSARRVDATVDPTNAASIGVLRACGFRLAQADAGGGLDRYALERRDARG